MCLDINVFVCVQRRSRIFRHSNQSFCMQCVGCARMKLDFYALMMVKFEN